MYKNTYAMECFIGTFTGKHLQRRFRTKKLEQKMI